MTQFQNIIICPLDASHDRSLFKSSEESLDRYLKKQAGQDIKRRISRVFVATESEQPQRVLGYYTLSSLSIHLDEPPEALSRKLPKHPIPAALIGRLAVDRSVRGHGIGKMLLADAVKRTLAVSNQIAIYSLVVDAIDNDAISFYERFGFVRFGTDCRRLFLPLNAIEGEAKSVPRRG